MRLLGVEALCSTSQYFNTNLINVFHITKSLTYQLYASNINLFSIT